MGLCKFALKTLKSNFKSSFSYLCSMIFPIAIIFNLLNIMTNSKFTAKYSDGRTSCSALIFLICLLVCIFTFYANSQFVTSTSKELAVAALSGVHPDRLGRMLLFQNTLLEMFSGFLGILLGFIIMPIFSKVMYLTLNSSGNLYEVSAGSLGGTLAVLILQLLYVSLGDYSYASTREIIDLINVEKKPPLNFKLLKCNPVTYAILYFFPILFFIFGMLEKNYLNIIVRFSMFFSIISLWGIVKYYIPFKILELKKNKYAGNKIILISLGNLHFSLKSTVFLIALLSGVVEALLYVMNSSNDAALKIVCIFSYITVLLLIASSLVYKFIMEMPSKIRTFKQLTLIGYVKPQLNKIINKEVFLLYSIIIGFPLIHFCIFIFMFVSFGTLSITLALILIFIFLFIFLLGGLISFLIYKNSIFKSNDVGFNKHSL